MQLIPHLAIKIIIEFVIQSRVNIDLITNLNEIQRVNIKFQ